MTRLFACSFRRSVAWFTLCLPLVFPHGSIEGQVVINEFLASNVFTHFDEEGKSRDWAELYNAGDTAVNLGGFGLSDDPLEPGRWIFPDVSIPPRGFLLVWLSGNNRFVPPPAVIGSQAGSLAFNPVFIPRESVWRYLVANPAGVGPPAGWNTAGFDDRGFAQGRSGFGYGDGDDFTELPAETGAVFLRKTFRVDDPRRLTNLVLQIDYDDGFVAYLNGRRVAARNAPAGNPDFASVATAKREAGKPERFDLGSEIVRLQETNVLAVVGLNDLPSSDMSLMPELGVVPLVLHANFSMDRDGEFLALSAPDGTLVDSIQFGVQTEDHSYGRFPDGGGEWFYFLTPTPEAPNTTRTFTEPIADRIRVDPAPGLYADTRLEVHMSAGIAAATAIHYTTDGSVPTSGSPRYTGPITITRNTVFRTAGFIEGERSTRVESSSFVLRASNIALPVLSISMDPGDYQIVHNSSGARGRSSEREGFMEYFEAGGERGFAHGFGLRLHGGAGRNGGFDTKKAYKAYFRGAYGAKKLRYPIIPETPVDVFDKLVLRSGFNDSFRTNGRATYLRDELIRDLHEDMGALVSHGSWCVLLVNMRLRGLYNIVERMDEEFLSSYLEGDDWDVIKTGNDVLVGSIDEWRRVRDFMASNDLTRDDLYERATGMIELENFTSYMILNMWAQNHDWPHNNWYAARRREPGARWIFLSWDAEFGIGLIPSGYTSNSFEFTLSRGGYIKDIFVNLLASPRYRQYFIEELDRHLAGGLAPANVLRRIRALRAIVQPDVPEELALFGQSVSNWNSNVRGMESFAQRRGPVFQNHVRNSSSFDFPTATAPRVSSASPSKIVNTGEVEVALRGARLSAGTLVFFDSLPAVSTRFAGSQLLATLPFDRRLSGAVTIRVRDRDSGISSESRGLLEVELPVPEPTEIAPAEGAGGGGDPVRIRGRYFLDDLEVFFGSTIAPSIRWIDSTADPAGMREIEVTTPPGEGTVEVVVLNQRPTRLPAASRLFFRYQRPNFVRGDADGDGTVDISDAIAILGYLFIGNRQIPCLTAADANGSGLLDLSDAVRILDFLFLGDDPPAAPYPACGEARPVERLPCDTPVNCPN